nr:hypothetical protein BaRGS_024134 [Batillaria attramentaria]
MCSLAIGVVVVLEVTSPEEWRMLQQTTLGGLKTRLLGKLLGRLLGELMARVRGGILSEFLARLLGGILCEFLG